jgi:hypothetical protein
MTINSGHVEFVAAAAAGCVALRFDAGRPAQVETDCLAAEHASVASGPGGEVGVNVEIYAVGIADEPLSRDAVLQLRAYSPGSTTVPGAERTRKAGERTLPAGR